MWNEHGHPSELKGESSKPQRLLQREHQLISIRLEPRYINRLISDTRRNSSAEDNVWPENGRSGMQEDQKKKIVHRTSEAVWPLFALRPSFGKHVCARRREASPITSGIAPLNKLLGSVGDMGPWRYKRTSCRRKSRRSFARCI